MPPSLPCLLQGPSGLHQYHLRTVFDEVPLPLDAPVLANFHEAKAFAAWKTLKEKEVREELRSLCCSVPFRFVLSVPDSALFVARAVEDSHNRPSPFCSPCPSPPQALGEEGRAYRLTTELEQRLLRGADDGPSSTENPEVTQRERGGHERYCDTY